MLCLHLPNLFIKNHDGCSVYHCLLLAALSIASGLTNPTAPARCKAVGQPFQAEAVYLVCAKPGGLGQPGKADVHTLRSRTNG